MSKEMKKAMMNIALMSVIASGMCDTPYEKKYEPETPRPKGFEPQGKSEMQLEYRKAHRKKLQKRRKARKGIYENKIKYKKKRGI